MGHPAPGTRLRSKDGGQCQIKGTSVYFRRLCKCPADMSWWSRFQEKRAASVAAFFIGRFFIGLWSEKQVPRRRRRSRSGLLGMTTVLGNARVMKEWYEEEESKCGDEDQELQEAGRMGGGGVRGARDSGWTAAGQALGRVVRIRFHGGTKQWARCASAGEVHDISERARGIHARCRMAKEFIRTIRLILWRRM